MNFSTRKWNKFLIGEARQEDVDRFLDRLSRIKPSEAPFDNIFKGKWRMVIPYAPKEYGYLRDIAAKMEELGHELEYVSPIPPSPRARRRDPTSAKQVSPAWMVIKKKDKDSWIERDAKLYQVYIRTMDDAEAAAWPSFKGSGPLNRLDLWAKENLDNPEAKAYAEATDQLVRHKKRGVRKIKLGKVLAQEFKDRPEVIEAWNNNAGEYNNKKNVFTVAKATEKYSTVISRHPVDIYRMSDHLGITSCHSLNSTHGHCATAEAEDFGMIAYVVKTKELEGIDIDADEIFMDEQRPTATGLKGARVQPVARKRLRRYFNKVDNYDLALPDKTEYGFDRMPGFMGFLTDWAAEEQRELVFGKDEIRNRPEITDFIRMGGSYEDSPDSELFNNMFNPKKLYKYRAAYKNDQGKIIEPSVWYGRPLKEWKAASQEIYDDIIKRIPPQHRWMTPSTPWKTIPPGAYLQVDQRISTRHDLKATPLHFYATFKMVFSNSSMTKKGKKIIEDNLFRTIMGHRNLDDEIRDIFEEHIFAIEIHTAQIVPDRDFLRGHGGSVTARIDIQTEGYKLDPDGFREFGEDLLHDLPNMIKASDNVIEAFTTAGIFGDDEEEEEEKKPSRRRYELVSQEEYDDLQRRTPQRPRLYEPEEIEEQTEPFQRKVKAKHKRMKIRLIGKGKGKHTAGSYKNKPSYKRSKSAPPLGEKVNK